MDGRKLQEARFRVSEMGVLQTPKRFLAELAERKRGELVRKEPASREAGFLLL